MSSRQEAQGRREVELDSPRVSGEDPTPAVSTAFLTAPPAGHQVLKRMRSGVQVTLKPQQWS